MPVGTVQKYDQMAKILLQNSSRDWDDVTPGNVMFCLSTSAYTPATTHTTTANIVDGGNASTIIAPGPNDGAPINVPTPVISTPSAGVNVIGSGDANFGTAVTITAKYLICVQPVVAGTFDVNTSVLLWYLDLDTTSTTTSVSSTASDFIIRPSTNGWVSFQ